MTTILDSTPIATPVDQSTGDSYVLVEGGLVQNDPALPVFDLDVLDADVPTEASANEALDLYTRISQHPQARLDLPETLIRIAGFVRSYGSAADIAALSVLEAAHLAE